MERKRIIKWKVILGVFFLTFVGPVSNTVAKDVYPTQDINYICYSQPGGSFDIIARGIAPFLSKHLREVSPGAKGGNIKVKNVTGGSGVKELEFLFKEADTEGYSIGDFNRGNFYRFYLSGEKLPFDITKFTWLYSTTQVNRVLISGKKGPKTWEEMLALSKKEPSRWGVSSVGGSVHLETIYILETTRIPSKITIWGSASQAQAAIIRGDADVSVIELGGLVPLIESKGVNVLVSFTENRVLPQVPTIKEKGFPLIPRNVGGQGIGITIGPPNLDPEAKRIIVEAAKKTMVDPGFLDFSKKMGLDINPLYGKEIDDIITESVKFYKEWAPIYKKYGL
ncbi:MAG: Bug family tripartite tricarboxylate transporter substrate binding protein [Thermodesulfobacteriota bacterium]